MVYRRLTNFLVSIVAYRKPRGHLQLAWPITSMMCLAGKCYRARRPCLESAGLRLHAR